MKNFRFVCIILMVSLVTMTLTTKSVTGALTEIIVHEWTKARAGSAIQSRPYRHDQKDKSRNAAVKKPGPGDSDQVFALQSGTTLQVDDGSFERLIGVQGGGTIYCLNRLTPPSYPATLTDVILFTPAGDSNLQVGNALTVLAGTNPDGDEDINGIALQTIAGTVRSLDQFNTYDVPDITINSGDFVVGYRMAAPAGTFPCALDQTPPSQERSYFSANGTTFTIMDDFGSTFAGNFGIRAAVNLGSGPSGCNPQNVSCPGTTSGSLSSGDCTQGRRGADHFTDVYQFQGTAGQTVTIDLTSSTLDTYLFLISPSGGLVAEDDDGGDGTNSRITFTLTASGQWRIEVSSFGSGATGAYSLTLAGCSGSSGCTPQNVSCPGTTSGSLSSGDCTQGRRGADHFTDVYQFQGTAGQTVTIDLTSSTLDTYLYLFSPSGSLAAENDDRGDGTLNSRITHTLTASGLWRIEASSFDAGETGAYSLALAGCGGGGPGRTTNNAPTVNRVDVSRIVMAHGRLDEFRQVNGQPAGIRSTSNLSGRCVPGITPVTLSAACQASDGIGLITPPCIPTLTPPVPPSVLEAIAAQANPRRITFDTDGDGRPNQDNPIALAACGMPSCFTLGVAEGISDPDGDPIRVRWQYPGARFGDGNLYATVDIPAAGITAGMELITDQQLDAYDANSILWEAPDVGPIIVDEIMDGGTEELPVRVIDIPPAPLMPMMSAPQSGGVEYARTIRAEIVELCKTQQSDGSFFIRLLADLPANSDDPLNKTWFRWAYEGRTISIVGDVPATNLVEFHVPKEEAGVSAKITVVASSFGAAVAGNPNPFITSAPLASCTNICRLSPSQQGSVGLTTFNSRGCTVSDTASVLVERKQQEICGNMRDDDCDGQIDEDCGFRLFVFDNQCLDDTIGVRVNGQDLGQTPAGQGQFFDIDNLGPGEYTMEIIAIASGGAQFGCAANDIVSYGVNLIGGVEFVRKDGAPFTGTSDSGEISVGTRVRYTIRK